MDLVFVRGQGIWNQGVERRGGAANGGKPMKEIKSDKIGETSVKKMKKIGVSKENVQKELHLEQNHPQRDQF